MNDEDDEVERRFLTRSDHWKTLTNERRKRFIRQAYPDSLQQDGVFARVRSSLFPSGEIKYERGDKGVMTGLKTPEDEWGVDKEAFERLMSEAGIQNLRKWRWEISQDGITFEVDQFTHIRNQRSDLVITEIEFTGDDAVDKARAFSPPEWVGEEITGLHQWSNFGLCMNAVSTPLFGRRGARAAY